MKKTLLLSLMLLSISAVAQDGIFFQPMAGAGVGSTRLNDYSYPVTQKSSLAYDVRLGLVFQAEHMVFTTGLAYMRAGYAFAFSYSNGIGTPVFHGKAGYYFGHVIVPATVGYKFNPGGKWSLTPTIGLEGAYNRSGVQTSSSNGSTQKRKIPSGEFDNDYKRFSAFGLAQLNFEFAINRRMSVVLAPGLNYMVMKMEKKLSPFGVLAEHPYSFILDAGVKCSLVKQKKETGPKK